MVTKESLKQGDVLLKVLCMSADPYQRGRIRSINGLTGLKREQNGPEPMTGFVSGKVLASRSAKWRAGDLFGGYLPLTTVAVVNLEAKPDTLLWPLKGITEDQVGVGGGAWCVVRGVLGLALTLGLAVLVLVLTANVFRLPSFHRSLTRTAPRRVLCVLENAEHCPHDDGACAVRT